jgi:hypothetical protein
MRIENAGDTKAARALLPIIREKYGTIPAFADAHGLDRFKLQKAIRGVLQRMDVPFARDIERATNGAVPIPWWAIRVAADGTEFDVGDPDPTIPTEPAAVDPTGTEGGS